MNNQSNNCNIRILYDHLCYKEKYGGVSRYFTELIKRIPGDNRSLIVKFSNNEYLKELNDINYINFLPKLNFRGKPRLIGELGKLFSLPAIRKGRYDIYHPTHYDCYGLDAVPDHVKTVATIHDMNFFVIPEYYPESLPNKVFQERMTKSVDHIITISQNTKSDIIKTWDIPEEKISVIYHGIDKKWVEHIPKIQFRDHFFLFVGRRSKYKNFELALHAFASLKKRYKTIKLYCTGSDLTSNERRIIHDLGVTNDVVAIQASNETLINLYRQAIGFIFPSQYEGFGLPILEAMASNCPCILSNASCFPEIAEDAALYFDLNNDNELEMNMEMLLIDKELRNNIIHNGNLRVADFSWDKCARQHMEVYKSIL